jgi:hypothetical protein
VSEFKLQEAFESLKLTVFNIREELAAGKPVMADRMLASLSEELHYTYLALLPDHPGALPKEGL